MAGAFDITAATTSIKLPSARTGQLQFTVTNTSGRQLTVRGKVVVQRPEQAAWFTIEGQSERPCAAGATLQYTLNIAVPPTAPTGPLVIRFDAIGVENPDQYASQGPSVIVDVPPVNVPAKPFPWWIVAVAAVAVLLVGGGTGLAWYLVHDHNTPVVRTSPTPLRSPSPAPDPVGPFLGTWLSPVSGGALDRIDISRQGAGIDGTFYTPFGVVVGLGTYDVNTDTISFTFTVRVLNYTYKYLVVSRLQASTQMLATLSINGLTQGNFTLVKQPCPPYCVALNPTAQSQK